MFSARPKRVVVSPGRLIVAALPFSFMVSWLVTVITLALFGGGLYLLWAWYVGVLVGTTYLILGAAMTAWTLVGRWIVLMLFRRGGSDEPKAIRPDSELKLARPDGSAIQVQVYGSAGAPPLVLTHGAGTNHTNWYYLIRGLSDRFQLITWDRAGLGASTASKDHDHSLEKQARDLEAVLSVAQGRPAVLVGHSMGGMTVLTFCKLFPDQLGRTVVGLGLVDTSFTNPARTTTAAALVRALQKPLLEPLLHVTIWLSPLFSVINGTAHIASMFAGFAGSDTRGQLDLATLYNAKSAPAVRARETLAMFRYDATQVLPMISIPARVFTGHLDRLIVPETAGYLQQHLPKADLVRLEPAGHMSIFERGHEVSESVGKFADDVQPAVRGKALEDLAGSNR
jgi:pimeloyl-ACP methyl ester carboxylesterase